MLLGFLEYLSEDGTYIVHPKTGQVYTGRENSLHVSMAHQAGLPRSGKGYDAIHKGRWAVSHSKKEVDIQGHVGHPSNNVVSAVQRRHPGYNINTHSREAEKTALRKIDRTGD